LNMRCWRQPSLGRGPIRCACGHVSLRREPIRCACKQLGLRREPIRCVCKQLGLRREPIRCVCRLLTDRSPPGPGGSGTSRASPPAVSRDRVGAHRRRGAARKGPADRADNRGAQRQGRRAACADARRSPPPPPAPAVRRCASDRSPAAARVPPAWRRTAASKPSSPFLIPTWQPDRWQRPPFVRRDSLALPCDAPDGRRRAHRLRPTGCPLAIWGSDDQR